MRARDAILLAALGALALAACGDGNAGPAAPQERAPRAAEEPDTADGFALTVEPAASEVVLGQELLLRVTVRNDGAEKRRFSVPRLDRSCATVRVRLPGANPFLLERLFAEIVPPGRLEWKAPDAQELAPGESLTGELSLTAAQVGRHHLTVSYRRSPQDDAVNAAGVEVTVAPDGDKDRLGVRIETSEGGLTVRLRPDLAPNTVESFATLARQGFFDDLTFHRIVRGFMAQGGDPKGTGEGGPGYFLPLEANRELLHRRGVLSMARTNLPDTAGSQFFLMFTDYPSLDPGAMGPGYTTFGETVAGEQTLTALESVETQISESVREQLAARGVPPEQVQRFVDSGQVEKSSPVAPVEMRSIRVVTLESGD